MNIHSPLVRPTLLTAFAALLCPALGTAQDTVKPNWQNLDLKADGVFGVSTERAYKELSLKKGKPVVVAVIGGGMDVDHEDLRGSVWTNPKEIPGNGKDDDKNGYVDDIHGWNFLGGPKGSLEIDNLEVTRMIRMMKPKYGAITDTAALSPLEQDSLKLYKRAFQEFREKRGAAKGDSARTQKFSDLLDSVITKMGKPAPTLQDFREFLVSNTDEVSLLGMMISAIERDSTLAKARAEMLGTPMALAREDIDIVTNIAFDPRSSADDRDRFYGDADLKGLRMDQGTAVAGIIGANRNNTLGINGVADNVQIMAVRIIPNKGDPRDKDIANAIRYAVDNGARIINMSFGREFSSNRAVVDSAVKYAQSKDVLVVHSTGSFSKNFDKVSTFPTRVYADGSKAEAWIETSSSLPQDDKKLISFSSYGKTSVDVFAPARIYTTISGPKKYGQVWDGSYSAATVSGVAALIRSRYPALTAVQVKDIIMQSVTKVDHEVTAHPKTVPFSETCVSGGIVNAYNALKLAATYKPAK